MVQSPTSPKHEGFLPLHGLSPHPSTRQQQSRMDEHVVNIPLTPIRTNASTGARRAGQTMPDVQLEEPIAAAAPAFRGRRRMHTDDNSFTEEEGALTTMGKVYGRILHFSIVTRYMLYILPLSLCFLVPILVGVYAAPKASVGGVRMVWFFVWLEIVWCSLWVSKLFAKALPKIFQTLVGVISSGVKKYSLVLKALELPLSFVGWAVASLCSFLPLMTKVRIEKPWQTVMNKVLISCLVSSLLWLAEKLLIQIVSVDYHRRQFAQRIKTNKEKVKFLSQLYEVSRNIFPEYGEFAEEDYIIRGALSIPGYKKSSGAATPMRNILGGVNMVQGKVASVFGNMAQEVTGQKNAFNPASAYAVTAGALLGKKSSEALARRIWMSFVPEDHSAMTLADLKEVMGPELEIQAQECFYSLDGDNNGDVSLEEMIQHTTQLRTERRHVAKSMQDVDNAISALDNVLSFIVFVIMILVFVVAQQSSVGTTIAGAGTVLISMSFVFAITAQEILGSCIFLFVKHPYDVGDRVDIDDKKYVVEHISLLFTVFKRVDNIKTTQIPNNVLNTKIVENITRSKFIQEQLMIPVHFDTSVEDIETLKMELMLFVRENSRDFQPEIEVEVAGINDLDKLTLRIELRFRETITEALALQRRNKFILALVAILKKIPIYAPGGGDPALGEVGKPMYTVAIPDELAQSNMQKAVDDKLAKRWDHQSSRSPAPSVHENTNTGGLNFDFATDHHSRSQFPDTHSRPPSSGDDARTLARTNSESSRRHEDLEEVRGLLNREPTRGRRRPAQYAPPAQSGYQYPHHI